jgi:methylase of polypeptide subunit release factors
VPEDLVDASPLLPDRELAQLRAALDPFTVDGVAQLLGPTGQAAQARGDLAGVARAAARAMPSIADRALATLVRMFLLGEPVDAGDADRALAPLPLAAAAAAGLVESSGGQVRACFEVRPYGEVGGPAWWVVSDFGADVRPGPLAPDHVLGVGGASVTLAQLVPRTPVGRALDIGTGSGVQALHLRRHATRVCATDTSRRALRCAATTAALSGQRWDLRAGSLFEPVRADERGTFDLVVANPPFVISGGAHGERYEYRDSGFAGDELSARLLGGVGDVLAPGGLAVVLVNWLVLRGSDWAQRPAAWLSGTSLDAWIWQREVVEPSEYVTLWLQDAGEVPQTERYRARYDEWLDWFDGVGAEAVGMGVAALWRTARAPVVRVYEDIPQQIDKPAGAAVADWIGRQRWLARMSDADLVAAAMRPAPGVVRVTTERLDTEGWTQMTNVLRQTSGLRWEVEADEPVAALLAGIGAASVPEPAVSLLAESLGVPTAEVRDAVAPVLRDLVARGFLLPGTEREDR